MEFYTHIECDDRAKRICCSLCVLHTRFWAVYHSRLSILLLNEFDPSNYQCSFGANGLSFCFLHLGFSSLDKGTIDMHVYVNVRAMFEAAEAQYHNSVPVKHLLALVMSFLLLLFFFILFSFRLLLIFCTLSFLYSRDQCFEGPMILFFLLCVQ